MPDIGKALKEEIARIARREAKQIAAKPRSDTAEIKRVLAHIKRQIALLEKAQKPVVSAFQKAQASQPEVKPEEAKGKWFTGRGVLAMRKRLGLSQLEFARLLQVSQKAVSHWELKKGKLNLRSRTVKALVAVRAMGKKQVRAQLGDATSAKPAAARKKTTRRATPSKGKGKPSARGGKTSRKTAKA